MMKSINSFNRNWIFMLFICLYSFNGAAQKVVKSGDDSQRIQSAISAEAIDIEELAEPSHCCGEYFHNHNPIIRIRAINPFTNQEELLHVQERDGFYIWQGDIIVGKVNDSSGRTVFKNSGFWTNNTIPYAIGSGFSASQISDINAAASQISDATNLNIIARTTEPIYVQINTGSGCGAGIGMPSSGQQTINLSSGCSIGIIMHEFLHTAGIHHEQTREDRDEYVTINTGNIVPSAIPNFSQQTTGWSDHGAYDYGSIMHYGAFAFAINPSVPTITTIPPGTPIGQRNSLSAGDIAGINQMYPECTSSNLTYTGPLENGRYRTSGEMTIGGTIDEGGFVLLSGGTKVRIIPGASLKSGADAKTEIVLNGCNID